MRLAPFLAALLLLTAGCVGTDEDSDPADVNETPETSEPTRTWESVERSGTVSGAGTPAGSVSQGGGNSATWTVPDNSTVMYLNVTTEGGELDVQYGSDCNTEQTVECEHEETTEDGELRVVVDDPASGGWEAYFFHNNNAGETDWTLTATMGVVEG